MDDRIPTKRTYIWWEERSKLEKCFLLIMICFVIITICLSYTVASFPSLYILNMCTTTKCVRSAANILERIDTSVNPCDDFYQFTCSNPDAETDSLLSTTRERMDFRLKNIVEKAIHENESYASKLVKTIYTSCMNVTRIEQEGLNYVKIVFKDLGGWPVVEPNWEENTFDWKNVSFRLQQIGWIQEFFFKIVIGPGLKNSTGNILTITQPSMSHDNFKEGFTSEVKTTYELLVEFAVLFGADRGTALMEMMDVVDFEINFAKILMSSEELKNLTTNYNLMTVGELQGNFSSIPWLRLINDILSPIDILTSDDLINVATVKFFERLATFLPNVKKRLLANYMFSKLVRASIEFLPEIFKKKALDYRTVFGSSKITPRWKNCIEVTRKLHVAVSSIYIKKYFDKSVKEKLTELVKDVKDSFLDVLKKVGWMNRKTKSHALFKAEKINFLIAYPDEIFNDKEVDEYYEELELDLDQHYINLYFNLSFFCHMKRVEELQHPVETFDFRKIDLYHAVNTFYDIVTNTIQLPLGIVLTNSFDPERPHYMNYGTMGPLIGHEITHGFDDRGRQYDKEGNLNDWWEPETSRVFNRKAACFMEQYNNQTIPEIQMNSNVEKDLSEYIADNGGIKIAYGAYLKWLERNDEEEPLLPGLSYTQRQLFWISSTANECSKYKEESLNQIVIAGHYAPNHFRVNVPYMNSIYFGGDFNCSFGTSMNPRDKCRFW